MTADTRSTWTFVLLLSALLIGVGSVHAQTMGEQAGGHVWPPDVDLVAATGAVQVDASHGYRLDTDGDGVAEYMLDFGPGWYRPSSGWSRPSNGETVIVEGVVRPHSPTAVLVVLKLNGEEWRVSNEYGPTGWAMESHWSAPGDMITASGIVLVDSTYFYHHYYLDVDSDGTPDYRLGLGPMWYVPASGADWPRDGITVEISGWVLGGGIIPMLMVAELGGEAWRPESGPAPWAGSWMATNHPDTVYAYCVTDRLSSITFPPGHMDSQMGGMNAWPDSSFVEFWNVHPDSLPGATAGRMFMGFHVDVMDPHGGPMMTGSWGGGMGAGRMRFSGSHTIRLHYTDDDLDANGVAESDIQMHWWDEASGSWQMAGSAVHDMAGNVLSLTTSALVQYYALSAASSATSSAYGETVPTEYQLEQNYPNPFNPVTTIAFDLPTTGNVVLRVFDALGRLVGRPIDQLSVAGRHEIQFDAGALPSGVYLYQLEFEGRVESRRFTLLR